MKTTGTMKLLSTAILLLPITSATNGSGSRSIASLRTSVTPKNSPSSTSSSTTTSIPSSIRQSSISNRLGRSSRIPHSKVIQVTNWKPAQSQSSKNHADADADESNSNTNSYHQVLDRRKFMSVLTSKRSSQVLDQESNQPSHPSKTQRSREGKDKYKDKDNNTMNMIDYGGAPSWSQRLTAMRKSVNLTPKKKNTNTPLLDSLARCFNYIPSTSSSKSSSSISTSSLSLQSQCHSAKKLHELHRGGGNSGNTKVKRPRSNSSSLSSSTATSSISNEISTVSTKPKKRRKKNNTGFYYGIREDVFFTDPEESESESGSSPSTITPPSSSSSSSSSSLSSADGQTDSIRPKVQGSTESTLADIMGETLLELREMREDISGLREEILDMKEEMHRNQNQNQYQNQYQPYQSNDEGGMSTLPPPSSPQYGDAEQFESEGIDNSDGDRISSQPRRSGSFVARLKRQREYDAIAADVERWAEKLLFQEENTEENGWKEVKCNKMVRSKYNQEGNTRCFIKWMKDSRGKHAKPDDGEKQYPCIKCYATINAAFDDVCNYLADEERMPEYNDLVISHRDLEDVTPYSKITWSQCPQILFIKSRDFCTYCHHRWRKDGTQIVVNQACEHVDAPGNDEDTDGKICRAFALRGANFISPDPEDKSRTRFALLAHADPGGGVPQWAMKTAVNAVAPIEPFKLFHKIEAKVIAAKQEYDSIDRIEPTSTPKSSSSADDQEAEMCSVTPGVGGIPNTSAGRSSSRPGGLSQMGYACFWPKGGGLKE